MSNTIHIFYDQKKNKFVVEKELPISKKSSKLLNQLDEQALLISKLTETLHDIETFKIRATIDCINAYEDLIELMKEQEQELQQLEEKASYLLALLDSSTSTTNEKVNLPDKTRMSPVSSGLERTELTIAEVIDKLFSERG